jgi:hypothetical protein
MLFQEPTSSSLRVSFNFDKCQTKLKTIIYYTFKGFMWSTHVLTESQAARKGLQNSCVNPKFSVFSENLLYYLPIASTK